MKRSTVPFAFAIIMSVVAAVASSLPDDLAFAQSNNNIRITPEPGLVGPATKLTVLIADGDLNGNAGRIDRYEAEDVELVTFRTDRSELGEAVPNIEETGENTGMFEFTIQLETDKESCDNDHFVDTSFDAVGGSEPSIGACPGDVLSIGYEDSHTASGGEDVVSFSVEIKSWDPEFVADKDLYYTDDRITVTITDPDANRDPDVADSIREIRVFSESDAVGEEFSAIETDRNTGIFRFSFATSLESQGSAISVKGGDDLIIEYIDEFPADADMIEKTFTFSIPIPQTDNFQDPLNLSLLRLDTTIGNPTVGNQMTLSVDVTNNNDLLQPFVQAVEVRNAEGITVFLAWQGGTLGPLGETEVGVLWTPDQPGNYEIRTFAFTDFENPQVLSKVQESGFTIE